jgi:hypothetical protein
LASEKASSNITKRGSVSKGRVEAKGEPRPVSIALLGSAVIALLETEFAQGYTRLARSIASVSFCGS